MAANIFETIITEAVINAVFETLLNSLWIGALMALLAGMVIIFTKKSVPQLRYQLLTGLLVAFSLCSAFVFYNAIAKEMIVVDNNNSDYTTTANIIQSPGPQLQQNIMSPFTGFIKAHTDSIVWLWFTVICFKCTQLISGLRLLRQLKRKANFDAGEYWNQKILQLAKALRISQTVLLLQSSLAKVPMVIGHFKPVILFPVGLLNALTVMEVEAILLHELAHIQRNDFLVNLLQKFVEIIFFFNPAVLWVSSLIRNERENCCDAIAIKITHDKKIFIHALVAFQEYNNSLSCATTFPGSKNHLLNRVTRIVTNNNKTLNNMEKIMLVSGILLTGLAVSAFTPKQQKGRMQSAVQNEAVQTQIVTEENSAASVVAAQNNYYASVNYTIDNDTIPKAKTIIDSVSNSSMNFNGIVDGKKVELKETNGVIRELTVDGKTIPEDQFGQYKTLTDKIHKQMQEEAANLKADAEKMQQQKIEMERQTEAMKQDAERMKEQSKLMQEDIVKQKETMQQQQVEMQKQTELMKKKTAEMKAQSAKVQADMLKQQEHLKKQQYEMQRKNEELKLQLEQLKLKIKDSIKVITNIKVTPAVITKSVVTVSPVVTVNSVAATKSVVIAKTSASVIASPDIHVQPAVSVVAPVTNIKTVTVVPATTEDIISYLEDEGIINSRNNLSFQLTNDAFIVNGLKQPAVIHQKIFNKYARNPGDTISISYSNNSNTIKENK